MIAVTLLLVMMVTKSNGATCAIEGGYCHCDGYVWYGAQSNWVRRDTKGSVSCTNNVFSDPLHGVLKKCVCVRGYFSDRYASEIFIIMTHNSLAKAGKVLSPNQNHDLARQFRDGVRGFNLDLYWHKGKIITKHGGGVSYDPSGYVTGLKNELSKIENKGEFIIVQLQASSNVEIIDEVGKWFGDLLVKNFNINLRLDHYIQQGQQVLVFTDSWYQNSKGIHATNQFIVENSYKWNTKWYTWALGGWFAPITGLFGSPFLELIGAKVDYRRGPDTGKRISLMNYFCCDGTGSMAKASRIHRHHTVRRNMNKYKEKSYSNGKVNVLMVDYYDVNNNGILRVKP